MGKTVNVSTDLILDLWSDFHLIGHYEDELEQARKDLISGRAKVEEAEAAIKKANDSIKEYQLQFTELMKKLSAHLPSSLKDTKSSSSDDDEGYW